LRQITRPEQLFVPRHKFLTCEPSGSGKLEACRTSV